MGLKAIVESVEDLPESVREFYKEDNGKFVLDIENVDDHPKVRGVVTANKENVKKRDQFKAKVEELTTKLAEIPEDFDAEQWVTLKASADPDKKKAVDEQVQSMRKIYEDKIANITKSFEDKIAAKDAEIGERDGYIDNTVVVGGLKDALLEVGVNPDLLDGALSSLRGSVKVHRSDDGNRKAIVETDLGEIDVPAFVKDWAGSKGKAYLAKPTGPDPKGNNRGGVGNKTVTRKEWDAMSHPDRAAKAKDGFKVID